MGQSPNIPPPSYYIPSNQLITTNSFTSSQQAQQRYNFIKQLIQNRTLFHIPILWVHCEQLKDVKLWQVITAMDDLSHSLRKQIILRKKNRRFFIESEIVSIFRLIAVLLFESKQILCQHIDISSLIFVAEVDPFLQLKIGHPELLLTACEDINCREEYHYDKLKDRVVVLLVQIALMEKVGCYKINYAEKINYLYQCQWISEIINSLNCTCQGFWKIIQKQNKKIHQQQKNIHSAENKAKDQRQQSISIKKQNHHQESLYFPKRSCKFMKKQSSQPKLTSCNKKIIKLQDISREYAQSIVDSFWSQNGGSTPYPDYNDFAFSRLNYQNQDLPQSQQKQIDNERQSGKLKASVMSQWKDIIPQDQEQSNENQFGMTVSRFHQRVIENDETAKNISDVGLEWMSINYEDGSKYEGEMIGRHKDGKGVFYFSDGGHYEGQWKNDEMEGFGQLYYPSGALAYRGFWHEGAFHGLGLILNQKPQQIDGEFDYRYMNKIGMKWISYEGNFYRDQKNGQGILLLSNGQKFTGTWKQNRVEGQGKYYLGNGQIINGIWLQNQLYHYELTSVN